MSMSGQEDRKKIVYKTPHWVQIWFLRRSRDRWKEKYAGVKADSKRSQNRVHDVTNSRQRWRERAEELSQRVQELEAENAALQEQLAALKKRRHVRRP